MFEQRAAEIESTLRQLLALANELETRLHTLGKSDAALSKIIRSLNRVSGDFKLRGIEEQITLVHQLADALKSLKIDVDDSQIATIKHRVNELREQLRTRPLVIDLQVNDSDAIRNLSNQLKKLDSLKSAAAAVRQFSKAVGSVPPLVLQVENVQQFRSDIRVAIEDIRTLRAEIQALNKVYPRLRIYGSRVTGGPKETGEAPDVQISPQRGVAADSDAAIRRANAILAATDKIHSQYAKFNYVVSQGASVFNSFREILLGISRGFLSPKGLLDIAGGVIGIAHSIQSLDTYLGLNILPRSIRGVFNQRRSETLADIAEAAIYMAVGKPDELKKRRMRSYLAGATTRDIASSIDAVQAAGVAYYHGFINRDQYEAIISEAQSRGTVAGRDILPPKMKKKGSGALRAKFAKEDVNPYGMSRGRALSERLGKAEIINEVSPSLIISPSFDFGTPEERLGRAIVDSYKEIFKLADRYVPERVFVGSPGVIDKIKELAPHASHEFEKLKAESSGFFAAIRQQGGATQRVLYARAEQDIRESASTFVHEMTHGIIQDYENRLKIMSLGMEKFADAAVERLRKESLEALTGAQKADFYKKWTSRQDALGKMAASIYSSEESRKYFLRAEEILSFVASSYAVGGEKEQFFRELYGENLYNKAIDVLRQVDPKVYANDFKDRFEQFVASYQKLYQESASILESQQKKVKKLPSPPAWAARIDQPKGINLEQQAEYLQSTFNLFNTLADVGKRFSSLDFDYSRTLRQFIDSLLIIGNTNTAYHALREVDAQTRRFGETVHDVIYKAVTKELSPEELQARLQNINFKRVIARSIVGYLTRREAFAEVAADLAENFRLPSSITGSRLATLIDVINSPPKPDVIYSRSADTIMRATGQRISDFTYQSVYDLSTGLRNLVVSAQLADGSVTELKGTIDEFRRFNIIDERRQNLIRKYSGVFLREFFDDLMFQIVNGIVNTAERVVRTIADTQAELNEAAYLFGATTESSLRDIKASLVRAAVDLAVSTGQSFEEAVNLQIKNIKLFSFEPDLEERRRLAERMSNIQLGAQTTLDLSFETAQREIPSIFTDIMNSLTDIEDVSDRAAAAMDAVNALFDKFVVANKRTAASSENMVKIFSELSTSSKKYGITYSELIALSAIADITVSEPPQETSNIIKMVMERIQSTEGRERLKKLGVYDTSSINVLRNIYRLSLDPTKQDQYRRAVEIAGERRLAAVTEKIIAAVGSQFDAVFADIQAVTGTEYERLLQVKVENLNNTMNQLISALAQITYSFIESGGVLNTFTRTVAKIARNLDKLSAFFDKNAEFISNILVGEGLFGINIVDLLRLKLLDTIALPQKGEPSILNPFVPVARAMNFMTNEVRGSVFSLLDSLNPRRFTSLQDRMRYFGLSVVSDQLRQGTLMTNVRRLQQTATENIPKMVNNSLTRLRTELKESQQRGLGEVGAARTEPKQTESRPVTGGISISQSLDLLRERDKQLTKEARVLQYRQRIAQRQDIERLPPLKSVAPIPVEIKNVSEIKPRFADLERAERFKEKYERLRRLDTLRLARERQFDATKSAPEKAAEVTSRATVGYSVELSKKDTHATTIKEQTEKKVRVGETEKPKVARPTETERQAERIKSLNLRGVDLLEFSDLRPQYTTKQSTFAGKEPWIRRLGDYGDIIGSVALPAAMDLMIGGVNQDNLINIGLGIAGGFAGGLTTGPYGAIIGYTLAKNFSEYLDIPGIVGTSEREIETFRNWYVNRYLRKTQQQVEVERELRPQVQQEVYREVIERFNIQDLRELARQSGLDPDSYFREHISSKEYRRMAKAIQEGEKAYLREEGRLRVAEELAGRPYEQFVRVIMEKKPELHQAIMEGALEFSDLLGDAARAVLDLAQDRELVEQKLSERVKQLLDSRAAVEEDILEVVKNIYEEARQAQSDLRATLEASYEALPYFSMEYGPFGWETYKLRQEYEQKLDSAATEEERAKLKVKYEPLLEGMTGAPEVYSAIRAFSRGFGLDNLIYNNVDFSIDRLMRLSRENQQFLIGRLRQIEAADRFVKEYEAKRSELEAYRTKDLSQINEQEAQAILQRINDLQLEINLYREKYEISKQIVDQAKAEGNVVASTISALENAQKQRRRIISPGTPARFVAPSIFDVSDIPVADLRAAIQYAREKQARLIGLHPEYRNLFAKEQFLMESGTRFAKVAGISQEFVREYLQRQRERRRLPDIVDLRKLSPEELTRTIQRARELQNKALAYAPDMAGSLERERLLILSKNNQLLFELGLSQDFLRAALEENTEATEGLRGHYNVPAGYRLPTIWDYYASGGTSTGEVNFPTVLNDNVPLALAQQIAQASLEGRTTETDLAEIGDILEKGARPFFYPEPGSPAVIQEMNNTHVENATFIVKNVPKSPETKNYEAGLNELYDRYRKAIMEGRTKEAETIIRNIRMYEREPAHIPDFSWTPPEPQKYAPPLSAGDALVEQRAGERTAKDVPKIDLTELQRQVNTAALMFGSVSNVLPTQITAIGRPLNELQAALNRFVSGLRNIDQSKIMLNMQVIVNGDRTEVRLLPSPPRGGSGGSLLGTVGSRRPE